uniref:Uncharacterized protein n=1 Tax=Trichogramma kaykai TaxID=54128 RepID=A0ABD2WSJ1_9HYME
MLVAHMHQGNLYRHESLGKGEAAQQLGSSKVTHRATSVRDFADGQGNRKEGKNFIERLNRPNETRASRGSARSSVRRRRCRHSARTGERVGSTAAASVPAWPITCTSSGARYTTHGGSPSLRAAIAPLVPYPVCRALARVTAITARRLVRIAAVELVVDRDILETRVSLRRSYRSSGQLYVARRPVTSTCNSLSASPRLSPSFIFHML